MHDGRDVLSTFTSLRNRVIITLLVIVVYRLGTYIPLPFVDVATYISMLSAGNDNNAGLLGIINAISGGALGRYSVFSLNVMPYIVASIISQLFLMSFVPEKKREMEGSLSVKMSKYTRYLTIVFAIVQGVVLALSMFKSEALSFTYVHGAVDFFKHFTVVLTLVAGTSLLIWLGEVITTYGVGNGISVLIFTGIISELPRAVYSTIELGKVGAYSGFFMLTIFTVFACLMVFVVFMEKSTRNVVVHYPKRQMGNKLYAQQMSHIPIKLNIAGVIPAIFANTVMLAPASLTGLNISEFVNNIVHRFYSGSASYYIMYFGLIVFFAFFYTSIVFNPGDIAETLRKSGGIVSGMRPGLATADYIKSIVERLTCIGALYIAFICVFFDVVRVRYSIPFALGGTSVLIVVSVVNDIISQMQLHVLRHRYDFAIGKISLRNGGGSSL